MEKEKLFDTTLGDTVLRYNDAIVVQLNGNRNVASTSALNGGVRSDLKFVFNKSCGRELHGKTCPGMKGATHEEHFSVIARELGLDPATCTGMGTAALVENMAVATESYKELTVTAMATAGVDVNGGRAGDLARYDEFSKQHIHISPDSGTINVMVHINAKMPAGTLNRATVTATEAKSVALQELMANSMYSSGLATGSGTDNVMIIGNLDSQVYLENAGKHCKLGELIGTTVIKAVKEALDKQTGMNTTRQSSVTWQNKRYGITADKIWTYYEHIHGKEAKTRPQFDEAIKGVDGNKKVVACIASCVHLIDQYSWGLLDDKTVHDVLAVQIKAFRSELGLPELKGHPSDTHKNMSQRSFQEMMISPLIITMAHLCHK
jgi:adenosylcobinamide hydrolase